MDLLSLEERGLRGNKIAAPKNVKDIGKGLVPERDRVGWGPGRDDLHQALAELPQDPPKQGLREKQRCTSAACPMPRQPPGLRGLGCKTSPDGMPGSSARRQPAVGAGFTWAPPAQAMPSYHFSAGNSTGMSPQLGSRALVSPDCG